MGCCGGKLPPAEEFLVAQESAGEQLGTCLTNSLRMTGWTVGVGYTGGSGVQHHLDDDCPIDTLEGIAICVSDVMKSRAQTGVVLVGGQPERETLTISAGDDDELVAKLAMPQHLSLGIGASLVDKDGNVIAILASAETHRPYGMKKSSYCVYAAKPQFAGQNPDARGRYLWATCTRKPWTFACTVTNGAGAEAFKLRYPGRMGTNHASHKVMLSTADGQGVMLVGPTKEKPKRHNIECCTGGDPLLYICILYACNLAFDELECLHSGGARDNQNDFGGGMGGGD